MKRLISFIILFLLVVVFSPQKASASITIIAPQSNGASFNGGSATPITYAVPNCVVGEYIIFWRAWATGFGATVGTPSISGSNMTQIGTPSVNGNTKPEAWYFKVTTTGTNTISFAHTADNARSPYVLAAMRVSGVDQSSPLGATPVNATGATGTYGATLASATGRLVLSGMTSGGLRVASSTTASSGTLQVDQDDGNVTASFYEVWLGVVSSSGSASQTHTVTGTGTNWSVAMFDLVPDTTAPSAPGTPDMTSGTDSGTSSTDNITSDTTPDFTMSCESGATVTLAEGGTSLGTGTCASSTVTITSSALSETSHTIKAYQTDGGGNVSADSSTLAVTIDATAPVFSSVTPTSSSTITNVTTSSNISYTLSEAINSSSITITRTSGTADASSPHTCTLVGTGLSSGAHTINLADTTNGCTSDVSNLAINAVYTFVFAGTDAAGNTATAITRTSVTYNPDSTAPVISNGSPSGSLPLNTTSTTLSVTTDENATCKYGTTPNTAYGSIASTFNTTGTTSHSQSISGLTNNSSYTFFIRCIDGFSNANTSDYTISFSVSSSAGGSGGLADSFLNLVAAISETLPPSPNTTETLPTPTEISQSTIDGCRGGNTGFDINTGQICNSITTSNNSPLALTTKITPKSTKTAVMNLQNALNHALGINLKVLLDIDGGWGPKTTNAVKLFQRLHNLTIDGLVGPLTRAAMNLVIGLASR